MHASSLRCVERVTDRMARLILLTVGLLSILTFLVIRLPRAQDTLLSTDGPGYVAYLRSVVLDGDLDFRNDYAHFGWYEEQCVECGPTTTGLAGNACSTGPAVLWAPFYLLAHVISRALYAVGIVTVLDGWGLIYESAICIGTIVYVSLGCLLTYSLCRRYYSPFASLLGVLGIYLGSTLIHYTVAAGANSHAPSFFAVALFMWLWHPPRQRMLREWLLLGLSAGLMAMVRWQDILYVAVLAPEVIGAILARDAGQRPARLKEYTIGILAAAIMAGLAFLPQALAWQVLYGSPIAVPQGRFFLDWLHPVLLPDLFSTRHGLFTWHPIFLLATAGLALLWRRNAKVALALALPLLLTWYVNSICSDWSWQSSFGERRFTSAAVIFALGIASLTDYLNARSHRGQLALTGVVIALVGWNFLFEMQFSWGFIPHNEAISLHQLTLGKFEMVLELLGRLLSKL